MSLASVVPEATKTVPVACTSYSALLMPVMVVSTPNWDGAVGETATGLTVLVEVMIWVGTGPMFAVMVPPTARRSVFAPATDRVRVVLPFGVPSWVNLNGSVDWTRVNPPAFWRISLLAALLSMTRREGASTSVSLMMSLVAVMVPSTTRLPVMVPPVVPSQRGVSGLA